MNALDALRAIWSEPLRLAPSERGILTVVILWGGLDLMVTVPQQVIADAAGCSTRSVRHWKRELESRGLLSIRSNAGYALDYSVPSSVLRAEADA